MRLAEKVGIVVGAGQSPGETVGTGRAAAILFAREGAKVLLVDRDIDSALETASMIGDEGGVAQCVAADWTDAASCAAFASACVERWERIDFLQNNRTNGYGQRNPRREGGGGFRSHDPGNPRGWFSPLRGGPRGRKREGS